MTNADGSVCELCLWLAATAEQRQRGLMGVTDLGAADGMVFVYDAPRTSPFWMRDTPMPLTSPGSTRRCASCRRRHDAVPDRPGRRVRPLRAAAAYTAAIEVPAGGLAELGIGPGSVLHLDAGAGCDVERRSMSVRAALGTSASTTARPACRGVPLRRDQVAGGRSDEHVRVRRARAL